MGWMEAAVKGISNPYILAVVLVLCFLIWNLPAIITATATAIREGRSNRVEVEGRRKLLASQIKSAEDKRLRQKRRQPK